MINSDPSGHCNVLWLGFPVKAARACTCPSQGSSSPCSLLSCAEMLRRIILARRKQKKNHTPLVRHVWTGNCPSSSWAVFLPCYSPMSKIASDKVQGWNNTNLRQTCVCAHQVSTESQTEDWTCLTAHGTSKTLAKLHLSCFKLLLILLVTGASVFAFEGWNYMTTNVLSNPNLSMILYERFSCYISVHVILNYIIYLALPTLYQVVIKLSQWPWLRAVVWKTHFSCCRCPLSGTICLWERTNLAAHKQPDCNSSLWLGR